MVVFLSKEPSRVVEAFVGEYASGKSEIAINRALELKNQDRRVTLVDLDTVEPFYTLRPIKKVLEAEGLNIIAYSRSDSFGLGETGAMLNPRARWALMNEGDIILDIGYGVSGAQMLNLVEGAYESSELRIIAVLNYSRPMTGTRERLKDYIVKLGRVDAIIANTHLGDESTLSLITEGNYEICRVAKELNIPVDYMAIDEKFRDIIEEVDLPVKFLKRYMPSAIW
ncbi:MAG: hypothetical protein PHC92_10820 [Syntrophomonadaceae bacterium]|nr:hypothetical protein [Syntrophomonadaceae bacterium]MDD3022736.1 hypothetical protein [Syntrophomonadaceae bacterium]